MNTLNVVESVFFAALEQPDAEARAAYLDQACGGDADLRRCVERLISAHGKADGFMQSPAPGLPVTVDHAPLSERPGTVIGPYKLLQELGEGGFGVVFLAEQAEPVRRKVALKVIKPGMDSRQVVARFEQERQALALMDHPNIAKVLDGGTTESGRPYFVMELVKGVPITKFCDENRLSPRERLGLFAQACAAVQHAHQKGVIHRDLKPSNVLVTAYDDKPVVKVIDFGVAKAVEQRLTEQTLFTRVGQVVGTLEYMSPEQASLNALDVDTRSDVYALGVLMYKLLTGSTPLDRQRLEAAGFAEMLRLIREAEPPRPSARLSSSGQALPQLAAYRRTDPARLSRLVSGELDWITMRALEKDRTRRYQSAAALADDVGRYLRDEPVEACPPSWGYRAAKFARKHRAALTLAGTAAALLLAGTVVSAWQASRAFRAERDALEGQQQARDAQREAEREADAARAAREEARRSRYGLAMNLIQTTLNAHNYRRAADLLEQLRPGPGEVDLRGFEWHYLDRQLNQQLRTVRLGPPRFAEATLSGDGSRVAYSRFGEGERPALKVADSTTGRVLFSRSLKPGLGWHELSLNRDGSRVAFRLKPLNMNDEGEDEFEVYDVDAGRSLFTHKAVSRSPFSLDRDGRRLATGEVVRVGEGRGDVEWAVKVWDLAAPGKPVFTATAGSTGPRALQLSPDGARLAASFLDFRAPNSPGRVTVWDVKAGKAVGDVSGPIVTALAFSPDGQRLAGVGHLRNDDRETSPLLNCWDCSGGLKELSAKRLPIPRTPLALASVKGYGLTFGPKGRVGVWTTQQMQMRVIDAATGEEVRAIRKPYLTEVATFSEDGSRLFTLGHAPSSSASVRDSDNGLVWQEWDARELPRRKPASKARSLGRVAWDRDGEREARSTQFGFFTKGGPMGQKNVITIRDRAGKVIRVFDGHAHCRMPVSDLQFSRDGRLVYSHASAPEDIRVWEADTGKVLWSYTGKDSMPFEAVEGAGRATFSDDGRLMVRPGPKGAAVVRFEKGLPELIPVGGGYKTGSFTPDAGRLVTFHVTREGGAARYEWKLWDVGQRRLLLSRPVVPEMGPAKQGHRAIISNVMMSPDGRVFLLENGNAPGPGGTTELYVYDAATAERRFTLKGTGPEMAGATFNRDGTRLITGAGRQLSGEPVQSVVWDLTRGKKLFHLEGHPGRYVTGFAFSPDGRRIASAARDEVKLWDAGTGVELLRAEAGPGAAGRVRFSDDGHRLILTPPGGREGEAVLDGLPRPGRRP